jgi:hypothetical protein
MHVHVLELDIYHEAGHAAVFRHYRIPIASVIFTPDLERGYGGHVLTACHPPTTGRTALENWMRASAAGQAAADYRHRLINPRLTQAPEATTLIEEFERFARDIADRPDSPQQHDVRNFVLLALARDSEIRESGSDAQTGPSAWAVVWLDAVELVRSDDVWPVVKTVALDVMGNLRDLTGEEYEAIAATATARRPR